MSLFHTVNKVSPTVVKVSEHNFECFENMESASVALVTLSYKAGGHAGSRIHGGSRASGGLVPQLSHRPHNIKKTEKPACVLI